MGNKPKNVLFNIMTKRHYLAFGHDVVQNGLFVCLFVWFLVNAQVSFGFTFCLLCIWLRKQVFSLEDAATLLIRSHITLLIRSHKEVRIAVIHLRPHFLLSSSRRNITLQDGFKATRFHHQQFRSHICSTPCYRLCVIVLEFVQ